MLKLLSVGVQVDTVLSEPAVVPGGDLTGEVRFTGGPADHEVQGVTLVFFAGESISGVGSREDEFHRVEVSGPFVLPARTAHAVPFRVPMPWETPLTEVRGEQIKDLFVYVRTELALAGARDRTDKDPLRVRAMPAQQHILDALATLGFRYFFGDLERGTLAGSSLPIWQELEFRPSARYAGSIRELEVTFVAGLTSMDVILEWGRIFDRFTVDYSWLDEDLDWVGWLLERIDELDRR